LRVEQTFSSFESPNVFQVTQEMIFSLPGISTGSGALPYIHDQSSPSAEWIVNHNFGYNPVVDVIDTANRQIEAEVVHLSLNQTRVYFNQPKTGKVIAR
jgi:hypothetical protein